MIKKIVLSYVLICLFIAIPLAIAGIKKVEPGTVLLAFSANLNNHFEAWKLDIPDIPDIPIFKNATGIQTILNVLIGFVNMITTFINVMAYLFNVIINIIQYILTIIFEIGYSIGYLIDTGSTDYVWPIV